MIPQRYTVLLDVLVWWYHKELTQFQMTGRFDLELVSVLPASLKFIAHNGAGYDSIDATACAARGLHPHLQGLPQVLMTVG